MKSTKNDHGIRRLLEGLHGSSAGTSFAYDPALRSWIISTWLGSEAIVPEDDLREFIEQFLALSVHCSRRTNSRSDYGRRPRGLRHVEGPTGPKAKRARNRRGV